MPEAYPEIRKLLDSSDPDELHQGLRLVRDEISRVGSEDARPLFEMIAPLFYTDPLDNPELLPVLDEAISLCVGFGDWVIPALMEQMDAGDIKAQLAIGHALGRLGADAVAKLIELYRNTNDPAQHVFLLYALGKVKSPKTLPAVPIALEAAESDNDELRDTAMRSLGKFAEHIPPDQLPPDQLDAIVEALQHGLADPRAAVRAKAIRSYGKLAAHGHLDAEQRDHLRDICERLLGTDEHYAWDRAYLVRHEAEQALESAKAPATPR